VTAVALAAKPTVEADDEIDAGLRSAVKQEFLASLSWDPAVKVLTLPQDHPVLGWKVCAVHECRKAARSIDELCSTCRKRRTAAPELSWEEFLSTTKPHRRSIDLGYCSVFRCARPRQSSRQPLCSAHLYQQRTILRLPLDAFLAHPEVVPLPRLGPCLVVACTRDRVGKDPYCLAHRKRWRDARLRDGVTDEDHWRRTTPGITEDNTVSLRGLPPRVVAEVVYGLQERTKHGIKTILWRLRPLCDLARARQVGSLNDLEPATLSRANRVLRDSLVKHARRQGRNPETERHEDIWDLAVFGATGTLPFTEISQPWLREATKRWAFDDLPRRRGGAIAGALQTRVNSIAQLSDSLRLQRADHGDILALLTHDDITAFCNRLAYLTQVGSISAHRRTTCCRDTRHLLARMRALGLTRTGEPLAGLAEEFTLGPDDIPDEPEDAEAGKDLPLEIMRHLCAHLQGLEDTNCIEMRVAIELVIDTGRRPDEICHLHLDCLDRDQDGKPVMAYDNTKAHRQGRRLPIPETTAAVITAQQQRVRERFPNEPIDQLKLLPAPARNPTADERSLRALWATGTATGSAACPMSTCPQRSRPTALRQRRCCRSTRRRSSFTPTGTPTPKDTPTPVSQSMCCGT
jgi:integrase